ncbi:MAG: serine hydrolase domain-containing protein [Imperialibacter sp.]|uniref:serine hydrolase domain-containing protein n=1 Tax=Imperialibacter sp. TaxID=2038411 RepID=UPI0032EAA846
MKQSFLGLVLVYIFYCCSPIENPQQVNKFESELDAIFAEFQNDASPGCAVAVFQGDKVVFQKGYGLANIENNVPITTSTTFDIASVSKQFTAYAAALLLEQGKIALIDDIKAYFPELNDFPHQITIDQLIHHTSGLRDWPQTLAVAGWSMEDELTYEQILRMAFAQKDLNYEPGTEYSYTNTGYVLLAELVSRVAEEPFHSYINKVVFEPLGMKNSLFNHDIHSVIAGKAQSYYKVDSATYGSYANTTTAMGSSSMVSTVEDLAKWLMFLSENPANSPAVNRLHERGVLTNGDSIHYAYGVWFEESGDLPVITHTGSWAGFRAMTMRFPTKDVGLVILSNYAGFDRYGYAEKVAKVFLTDDYHLSDEKTEELPLSDSYQRLAGAYVSSPTRIYELGSNDNPMKLSIDGAFEYTMVAADSEGEFFASEDPTLLLKQKGTTLSINGQPLEKIKTERLPLGDYTGTYFSDELQAMYKVVIQDEQLFMSCLRHGPVALQPIAGNLFAGGEWFLGRVLFTTTADGISGFQVFGGRVRRLHFRKVQSW